MQRVISETKIKIQQKKEDVKTVKALEKIEEVALSKQIGVDAARDKQIELQKKIDLKRGMDNQFEAMARIKNDQ